MGDNYWYQSGVRVLQVGASYYEGATYSGPLSIDAFQPLTRTHEALGSSVSPITPISSQVPTTDSGMISDIAFVGHLYSLHPTATNSSKNVGDGYFYQSGVRLSIVGGAYDNASQYSSGSLAFSVYNPLTVSGTVVGSSGTRTATNSSRNVGDKYEYQSGVRLLCAGGGYADNANSGPLTFSVYSPLTLTHATLGSSGTHSIY